MEAATTETSGNRCFLSARMLQDTTSHFIQVVAEPCIQTKLPGKAYRETGAETQEFSEMPICTISGLWEGWINNSYSDSKPRFQTRREEQM